MCSFSDRVTITLDMSSYDYTVLNFALHSARGVKQEILSFYEGNPDEKVMTPLAPLRSEIDALERLLHIVETSGRFTSVQEEKADVC